MFRGRDDDAVAIRHARELRELGAVDVGRAARADRPHRRRAAALGVGRGDRVAAYMPEHPRDDRGVPRDGLARRVWSSAAPEFGARRVIDRFAQIEPKVLLAVDGYRYGGSDFDRGEAVGGPIARAEIGARGRCDFGYLDAQRLARTELVAPATSR